MEVVGLQDDRKLPRLFGDSDLPVPDVSILTSSPARVVE